jgi:hypothetical protein
MNKFLVVLLLAFGAVSSFRIREIPVDQIYDAVVALFKGMAETSECKCAAVLTNNKAQILEIVYAAIDEVKAGTPIETAVQNAALKLMGIDGLVSECNVLAMPAIITKITTKDGLVEIFQTMIDNIDEVYSYGEKIKEGIQNKDYNAAAEAFGHIFAIAFDFHVNL